MANSKRNEQNQSGEERENTRSSDQSGEAQNTSNEQDDNPQRGEDWNNYQTREMSGGGEEGESFYRNHERGNMDERSDDSGGSLF